MPPQSFDPKSFPSLHSLGAGVTQSNVLINGHYELSVVESRILYTAISQLNQDEDPSDQKFYWVTVDDMLKFIKSKNDKLTTSNGYRYLKESSKTLYRKEVRIFDREDGLPTDIRWIQAVKYDKPFGRVGIKFSNDILPYLTYLRKNYTKFLLLEIAGLTSWYAVRIFVGCRRFVDTGIWIVTIDELRACLCLTDKYKSNNLFIKKIVDIAVKQINANPSTTIEVSYSVRKKGRNLHDIVFAIFWKGKKKEDEKKLIQLSISQAMKYAVALVNSPDLGQRFNESFRTDVYKGGVNLINLSRNASIAEIVRFLIIPENATAALRFLEVVGFKKAWAKKITVEEREAQKERERVYSQDELDDMLAKKIYDEDHAAEDEKAIKAAEAAEDIDNNPEDGSQETLF